MLAAPCYELKHYFLFYVIYIVLERKYEVVVHVLMYSELAVSSGGC